MTDVNELIRRRVFEGATYAEAGFEFDMSPDVVGRLMREGQTPRPRRPGTGRPYKLSAEKERAILAQVEAARIEGYRLNKSRLAKSLDISRQTVYNVVNRQLSQRRKPESL
jgi:transposase